LVDVPYGLPVVGVDAETELATVFVYKFHRGGVVVDGKAGLTTHVDDEHRLIMNYFCNLCVVAEIAPGHVQEINAGLSEQAVEKVKHGLAPPCRSEPSAHPFRPRE